MLRPTRGAGRRALGLRSWDGLWPLALAVVIRLMAWAAIPASRFASDEESYFQVATALLTRGEQDLFWPPVTGWLIALCRWILHTDSVSVIRLVWIALDVGCLITFQALARRVAPAMSHGDPVRAARYTALATISYAVYLPAIAHAQFATSETPALLQTLAVLLLLSRSDAGTRTLAGAGVLLGTLALTRPSLLPLLILLPAAWAMRTNPVTVAVRRALIAVLIGSTVIGVALYRNWALSGEITISRNSAYNLYLGNQDVYAEDLNLFSPRATPEQIEFRRRMWRGEAVVPDLSAAQFQRQALDWIVSHPAVFARRAAGRLARVFAPKTDVLELAGGEQRTGVFAPVAFLLLSVANSQWIVVLAGGLIGLTALWRHRPDLGRLLIATVVGSLLLCLVAIAKPRYSFVFDPVLMLGAVACLTAPRETLARLQPADRNVLLGIAAFLSWGWVAWLIFSVSSRTAL